MAQALGSQHTNTFSSFLMQSGVSILVSTYQAGKLILLRNQQGVLNTHFLDIEKPMGIALKEPHLAIGTGAQVNHYFNMPDVAAKLEPANSHNACYLPRETHITGDIDIHEMAFGKEKILWLVNTRMSCLCTLDTEHSVIPEWRPPFISAYDLSDRCHLNGLAMKNGKPAYVTALGNTDTPAGWRKNKATGGILMNVKSNEIVSSGLSMPHSPRWYQDKLWILESGKGSLASVDPRNGKINTLVKLPGFTRGLDFYDRFAFIGLSQVRETAVFAGLPLTKRCQERQCGVYIVDIVEGKVIGFMVFSGEIQEIFSIQILPSSYPDILALDDPLLRTSYALPDQALKQLSKPDTESIALDKILHYHKKGDFEKAITAYNNFLTEYPDNTLARYYLGLAYIERCHWKQAIETFQRVLVAEPHHAEAANGLGQALAGAKQWRKAKFAFGQALAIDQEFATAHVYRGFILLRQGNYTEGWKELEWRWKTPSQSLLDSPNPRWQGEDIKQKTILVHTQKNLKEAILFARFIPLLDKLSKHVIVACTEPLRHFFKSIDGVNEVRVIGNVPNDHFQVFVPLESLPKILGITLENLPTKTPYWHIVPEVVVSELQTSKQFKVGLVWKNDIARDNLNDENEIFTALLALANISEIKFYSLQPSLVSSEKQVLDENKVINLESDWLSYAHAGALIDQLDLVISVNSTTAHLSASLNKPTWIILDDRATQISDWHWLEEKNESIWYPSVRIFRKSPTRNWTKMSHKLRESLMQSLNQKHV